MVKKVLIVDDDRDMLLSLEEGLLKYDETFSIVTAQDGLGAVNQLRDYSISLVVTDLKMPRMDGFSLLSHIMEHYPEIPVIIITGYSTLEMERLAREGGAIGYIAKPFMIDDLAKRIITSLRTEADGGTL
ncbi:MAG: CheY-like receiver, AAA-type ATPase and DNA-binding response regulator, partial [Deltaproteobacteria bacterium]|nr:CheY-like receiver, AAA-type ATPase and DNA-binding response regulator [Deltaproteobacteria bacterium]